MHLNISTDYAIRMVLYLAKKKRLVQSRELSQQLHIPQGYVLKVAGILKKAHILEGGYRDRWRYAAREASKRHPHL